LQQEQVILLPHLYIKWKRGVFMKKAVSVILFVLILFSNCITVFANYINGTDLTSVISEENKKEIMNYASRHLQQEISEKDIFFDETYAVYLEVYELLDYDVMTEEIIKELCRETTCIFHAVPVYGENKTLALWIARDDELNGDFKVTGGEEDPERFNHIESIHALLDANGVADANVYLFGGVNGKLRTIAAVCRENEDVQFLILHGSDENDKMYSDLTSTSRLYSYEEIKYIASLYTETEGYDGGEGGLAQNNLQYACLAGGAVLMVTAVAVMIRVAARKKAEV